MLFGKNNKKKDQKPDLGDIIDRRKFINKETSIRLVESPEEKIMVEELINNTNKTLNNEENPIEKHVKDASIHNEIIHSTITEEIPSVIMKNEEEVENSLILEKEEEFETIIVEEVITKQEEMTAINIFVEDSLDKSDIEENINTVVNVEEDVQYINLDASEINNEISNDNCEIVTEEISDEPMDDYYVNISEENSTIEIVDFFGKDNDSPNEQIVISIQEEIINSKDTLENKDVTENINEIEELTVEEVINLNNEVNPDLIDKPKPLTESSHISFVSMDEEVPISQNENTVIDLIPVENYNPVFDANNSEKKSFFSKFFDSDKRAERNRLKEEDKLRKKQEEQKRLEEYKLKKEQEKQKRLEEELLKKQQEEEERLQREEVKRLRQSEKNANKVNQESMVIIEEEPLAVQETASFEEPVEIQEEVYFNEPIVTQEPFLHNEQVAIQEDVSFKETIVIEEPVLLEETVVIQEEVSFKEPIVIHEVVSFEETNTPQEEVSFKETIVETVSFEETPMHQEEVSYTDSIVIQEPVSFEDPIVIQKNPEFISQPSVIDEELLKEVNRLQKAKLEWTNDRENRLSNHKGMAELFKDYPTRDKTPLAKFKEIKDKLTKYNLSPIDLKKSILELENKYNIKSSTIKANKKNINSSDFALWNILLDYKLLLKNLVTSFNMSHQIKPSMFYSTPIQDKVYLPTNIDNPKTVGQINIDSKVKFSITDELDFMVVNLEGEFYFDQPVEYIYNPNDNHNPYKLANTHLNNILLKELLLYLKADYFQNYFKDPNWKEYCENFLDFEYHNNVRESININYVFRFYKGLSMELITKEINLITDMFKKYAKVKTLDFTPQIPLNDVYKSCLKDKNSISEIKEDITLYILKKVNVTDKDYSNVLNNLQPKDLLLIHQELVNGYKFSINKLFPFVHQNVVYTDLIDMFRDHVIFISDRHVYKEDYMLTEISYLYFDLLELKKFNERV